MSSYERGAREYFVTWQWEHRGRIMAVGIITTNLLYRMIISAMSFATQQHMRVFDDQASAREWLHAQ